MFKELDNGELKKFLDISNEQKFPAGTIIIEENMEGKALFVVKSGTVVVSKIDGALESELVKLFAGEHFGEMSLVEEVKTSARVSAYNDVVCIVVPKAGFQKLLSADFKLAAEVYKAFTLSLATGSGRPPRTWWLGSRNSKIIN